VGQPVTPSALYLIREVFGIGEYPLPEESLTVEHDGRCISHVGLFWRTITLTGHGPLDVGGVGLVCTATGWRRLGLATALLEAARRRSALHGRPHLALYAGEAESALYRSLGYQPTNVQHLLTFPPVGRVANPGGEW
jgi:GNAT superfamily N-acetyltransferase